MRKRYVACFISLLLLTLFIQCGYCEKKAKYTALTSVPFHLRSKPNGYRTVYIPDGKKVEILEWKDNWCLVYYQGKRGYCKSAWLYSVCSLDPFLYPLPDNPCQVSGYIVADQDMQIGTVDYDGTTVPNGEMVCAFQNENGLYELPVWREKQSFSDAEIDFRSFIPWKDAEPGNIIGGFTTYYTDKQGKRRPREREYNIKLGCERIDSSVLSCGETFSFNAVCGPYKKTNGYLLAPNISREGKGYGGGVCQVTTTLYNALLTIPVRIEEWSVHRYNGVSYVPQFFDAAVGTYSDFAFTNTLPYPIRIEASAGNGIINVFIYRAE